MGVVHLALDAEGHAVAIKVLATDTVPAAEDDNARRRLAREVDTMRRVRSPFVAEVLDADLAGEFPYIVTRYVPGPTLEQMVRQRGRLSSLGLRTLAYGTAEALAAIHAAGVVHRDLKPGNVMLADDRPVVIDFGIAQSGDATRLTQTGLVMGTPGYLAPEVIEGQPSTPASDVHSWGATMVYAATGRPPYPGESYEQIFYRIVSGRPDLAGVPAPLLPLVYAALARDPASRPSATRLSAQASALDLTAMAARAPATAALPPAPSARPVPPVGPVPVPPPNGSSGPPPARSYPAPKQAARDVADLLPPVGYVPARSAARPPAPVNNARPLTAPPAWPPAPSRSWPAGAPPGARAGAAGAGAAAGVGPAGAAGQAPGARGRPMLAGLAVLVAAVALAVLLPVAGLIVSLAGITLLRAADRAQNRLAARRSVRGPRASDPVVVVVTAPLAVARALLTESLMAPLAFAAGVAAYAAAIVLTHHHLALPRAGAYAAGAMVAWYAVGPGSGRPRRQLNRMVGAVSRSRLSAAAVTIAAWGLAAAFVLLAASQVPDYWPVATPHLPALHGLLSSATSWLLRHAHT
jgi:serine/threonine protein kinase